MIRRLITIGAVLAACVTAVVLTGASSEPQGKAFKAEFDNAFGLTEGGDLRIGGVNAGQTTGFDVSTGEPPKAIVEFSITEPGFDSLRSDARCDVRQQSLIGEYYVDCQPGSEDEELPEGGTIPVEQTSSIIAVDLVNNILRRPYRERLRLIIAELGTGLAGRPEDLAETIRRAHPGLRETSKTLGILKNQTGTIKNFVSDSDTVVQELADRKRDVARFVNEAGETAEITATRREELAEQFEKLPTFLRELEPTMARLGDLSDAQVPLLADLRTASSDLNQFFTELGPFAQSARPALRTLGDASVIGNKAFNESRDEIAQLRRLARKAPGVATPLRQFLVSLDDRQRGTERDERAVETAPPSPDPTSRRAIRGFTGFEAIANYFFWQTLSINGFDDVSHYLRVLGIEDECAPYSVDPSEATGSEEGGKALLERCNAYLGPNQPGIDDATGELNGRQFPSSQPDPTAGGSSGSSAKSSSTSDRKRGSDKSRAAKDGDAKATPAGKRAAGDTPKLPQLDKDVLDGANAQSSGSTPMPGGGGEPAPDQLLDFLLGP